MSLDLGSIVGYVELDTAKFDKKYADVTSVLERLARQAGPDVRIDANTAPALAGADRVESALRSIPDAEVQVNADTSGADAAFANVTKAGADAGDEAGEGLSAGIIAALATIPVAGAIIGIGAAIGEALLDGLSNEVREDMFSARTGLDEATAARFGRAAGEAYANNWGESIEANLDTARRAVEAGLLAPTATARESQGLIEQITAVATLLEEDIPRVTRTASQLIKTGMADDAAGAFDILVKSQQNSLNVSEDLLDTFDEYSTKFRDLGLDGPRAMGLLAQAVRAGARDTDTAADALKEFAIRAIDGSALSIQSFEILGLSARDMQAQIAAGGEGAAAGLDVVLDRLRAIEDPALRDATAVGLFGTKAEDLGDALYAMDLTNAVDQLGAVEGAAASALGTMGDNAANDIASAQRNIEVAADGIKGALAEAFGPQIEAMATFVTQNREEVLGFLLDISNGALDVGRSMVEGLASATEGIGRFIGGPMADLILAIGDVVHAIDAATPGDQHGDAFRQWARDASEGMKGIQTDAEALADGIREDLIENGIDPAQQRLNDFALPLIAQARIHDAAVAVASGIDAVGVAADQSALDIAAMDLANLDATESGKALDDQLRGVANALADELLRAKEAGEGQEDLAARYDEARSALMDQLTAMGLTQEQASDLIAEYGLIPDSVDTVINLNTTEAERRLAAFKAGLAIPDVVVTAQMRAEGGYYANRAGGGIIPGLPSSVDNVAIHAATGEFVTNSEATAKNRALLEAINNDQLPAYLDQMGAAANGSGAGPGRVVNIAQLTVVTGGDSYLAAHEAVRLLEKVGV